MLVHFFVGESEGTGATGADKIDAFLYEQARDLVAERFVSGKHRQGGLGLPATRDKQINVND